MIYNYEENRQLKIGEIYLMQFDGSGSEQSGWRPGLVFQNNTGNLHSPNVIALPLTSSLKKAWQPTHVIVSHEGTGLRMDSMVLCENPQRMSKEKIGMYITTLSDDIMRDIAIASLIATSAISFLNIDDLTHVMEIASSYNNVAKCA